MLAQDSGPPAVPRAPAESDAPLVESAEAAGAAPAPAAPAAASEVRRVLVVDDEEDLRSMIDILLGARGIKVVEASGGRVALALLETDQAFDDIILDMVMHGMDGGEVLAVMASRGLTIPVVMATGYAPEELDPTARAQVSTTLRKPFQTDALVAALTACVQGGAER
jgi:CheY-like chemotaxis protein